MKFIPDDINVDFMGARKKAFLFSGVLIAASLVALIVLGFNLGIDFKGGSEVIVAFEDGAITDRTEVRKSVEDFVAGELGQQGTQIEVQDFSAGAGDTITVCTDVPGADGTTSKKCDTKSVDRFSIYIEVNSLIGDQRRAEIDTALKAKFGDKTRIDSRDDADTFYINFDEDADILTREAELKDLFKGLKYENITVRSAFERQLELEFLREQELQRQDAEAQKENTGAVVEGPTLADSRADYEAKKQQELVGKSDRAFTVQVQELRSKIGTKLAADFGPKFVAVENTTSVSASVGADLFANGLLAILYAMVGILIYITVRFDFRYAPGAVIALIHDVIITMGIFAILRVKFSMPIIAALLTIVGYSLNDTIIVMDRVRETLDQFRGRPLSELLNKAINATLSRTVLTSGTTLLTVIAILVFGGGQIADFALALFIGITIGTYSSIYVASPIVEIMDHYIQRREELAKSASKPGNKPGSGGKKAKATA
ncbi:MAG: protein translocase subunit SecF [Deltaproteobacteria bacterium]|nr:protein translocase subunit SecF [Deltaproteobacteria bacterium]